MKLTALQRQAPEPAVALTVGLLQAIGADDFAGLLLRAIGAVLPVSHCTVFALRSSGRVERVSTASAVGEVASLTAVEYMRLGFDQQDSNMVWLARRKPSKGLQLWKASKWGTKWPMKTIVVSATAKRASANACRFWLYFRMAIASPSACTATFRTLTTESRT